MPTVEFTKSFRWSPPERNGRTDIEYEKGITYKGVRKAAAEAAVAAGAGKIVGGEDEPPADQEQAQTEPENAA